MTNNNIQYLFVTLVFCIMSGTVQAEKVPPPFPESFHSILTVTNNITGETMYSGRYWYDQQNQKERLDIKEHIGQLTMYITRYDLATKYIVHRNSSGYTCTYEELDNNTLAPPVNLTHAKFIGNETWWGEMCDHYQILDLKQDSYLEYYVIQKSNIPYGFTNSRHIQTTWMFTTVGPIDQSQFELPKGVNCGEERSRNNKITVNE